MNGDYLSSNAAKMISRRKPRNGDGGLKMPNNERSAEYWRGVLETAKQAGYSKLAIYGYEQLLAAAEAREGGENLAEISADRAWIDGAKFGWNCETKADLHEAIANRQQQIRECSVVERVNAAVQSVQPTPTQPTAAEVIEACEKALERLLPWALQAGAYAEDALALCARWKESNGGK